MYLVKKKWSSAKKVKVGDYVYDSRFEGQYAQELALRKAAGEITKWERQVKISLEVNGYHICNYYIDFIVYYPDGTIEYVETKGVAFPTWKLKWKLFEALFSEKPNVRLLVVQQKSNWRVPKARKIKN